MGGSSTQEYIFIIYIFIHIYVYLFVGLCFIFPPTLQLATSSTCCEKSQNRAFLAEQP